MTWNKWARVEEGPPTAPRLRYLDNVSLPDGWREYSIDIPDGWEMMLSEYSVDDEPIVFVRIRSPTRSEGVSRARTGVARTREGAPE